MYLANADKFRILVVEDDSTMRRLVTQGLKQSGFQTVDMASAEEAIDWMRKFGSPHLALVDIDLQYGMSGLDFCGIVRQFSEMPIVMMTANDEPFTIIQAIDKFAEDYITKPFNLEELLLRVNNLIRRTSKSPENTPEISEFGGNRINFVTYEATANGKTFALTKKEAMLLKLLVDRRNEVVSRQQILQSVWGYDVYPSTRTIDNFILSFRKYFEEDPKNPEYFLSVRGVGYKFVG